MLVINMTSSGSLLFADYVCEKHLFVRLDFDSIQGFLYSLLKKKNKLTRADPSQEMKTVAVRSVALP